MADEKGDYTGGRHDKSLPLDVILEMRTDVESILGDKEKMREFWYSLRLMAEMVELDEAVKTGNKKLIALVDENRAKILDEIDTKYKSRPNVNEMIIDRANQMYFAWNRGILELDKGEESVDTFSRKSLHVLDDTKRLFELKEEYVGLEKKENPFKKMAERAEELNLDETTKKIAQKANRVLSPYLFGMMEIEGGVRNQWMGKFGN